MIISPCSSARHKLATYIDVLNDKLPQYCAAAENLTEVVEAIRSIPEHKRMVVNVRNCESSRIMLVLMARSWLKIDSPDLDYPIASAIIALADSDSDEDAISLSRTASGDPSLEIASGIADTYLLKKALE